MMARVSSEQDATGWVARLRKAIEAGEILDLAAGLYADSAYRNPAHADIWGKERSIPAASIRVVLIDHDLAAGPQGLWINGARITGPLHLKDLQFKRPIRLTACRVEDDIDLTGSTLKELNLDGSQLSSLALDGATITGGMFASNGFKAEGEVRARRANIGGQLKLDDATLTNPKGKALNLDGATITGGMFASKGFKAEGEVRAPGAHIGGQLSLRGATLTNPSGKALNLDGATITRSLLADEGFKAEGEVRALRANIGGQLSLRGATLTNPSGKALNLDGTTITTLVLVPKNIDGELVLTRTTITELKTPDDRIPYGLLIATGWQIDDIHGMIRTDRRAAIDWLRTNPDPREFTAQPWHALAAVYDSNGQPADARRLRYLAANEITKHGHCYSKPLRWAYLMIAGNGYYPLLAAVWLIITLILGTTLVSCNRSDLSCTGLVLDF